MMISHSKIYTLTIAFLFTILCFSQTQGTRPNIILIFADDLGYADVGFNRVDGSPAEYQKYGVIPTPALDNLASNGVIMSSAHVAHPFCGPSRAALMTGVYPHRISAQYNLPHEVTATEGITVAETFMSKVLQDDNYNTAMFGKWHLGYANEFHPNSRGFDHFFGFLGGGHDYFESSYEDNFWAKQGTANPITNQYTVALSRNANYVMPEEFEQDEYLTNVLTEQAVSYIDSLSTAGSPNPFFIYMAYNAPHTPLEAPQADIDLFKTNNPTFETDVANSPDILNANIPANWTGTDAEFRTSLVQDRLTYATMVTIMDNGIGDIKQSLIDNGISNNTLIVFLSDNGGKLRQAGGVNYPLTQGKGSVDEGGHRVPMLMNWPAKITGGQTYNHLVTSIDLYPTFVNLAGAALPGGKLLEGTDIMDDVIANQDARVDEPIYVMRPQGTGEGCTDGFQNVSIKQGNWKIVKKANSNWKLYEMNPAGTNDIEETNDLSGSAGGPTIISGLVEKAVLWIKDFKDVKPGWFDNEEDSNHFPMWNDGRLPVYNVTFAISPNSDDLLLDGEVAQVKVTRINDATEGVSDGLFTVSINECLVAPVGGINVGYTASGTATNGVDYTAISGTVTILEGMNSADINILVPTDDGLDEMSETVIITLNTTTFGDIDSTPAEIDILDVTAIPDLLAGDVAIVGWKAEGNNGGAVAFMLLKDINATTKLSISNKTWNGSGWSGPYGVDDVWTWTPGAAYSVGDIFMLDSDGSVKRVTGDVETVVGSTAHDDAGSGTDSDFDLSNNGDGILIFHVDPFVLPSDPNSIEWITGLTTNDGWGTSGGNSACVLPAALTNGVNANAVGADQDYGVYKGPLSGSVSQLRASINNSANWITSETTSYNLWSFNETATSISGDIGATGTLSIKNTSKIDLSIFPNPTSDNFILNFGKTYNKVDVEILALTGKVIKRLSLNSENSKIDASSLQSGMYLLRIIADGNLSVKKIIKL